MKCACCSKEIKLGRYCPYCGAEQEGFDEGMQDQPQLEEKPWHLEDAEASKVAVPTDSNGGMSRDKKILIANGVLCAVLVALVGVGLATAVRWEKVDVPAHEETFHTEQKETGEWIVKDDRQSPCYANQPWVDCINLHISEYNGACVGRPLTSASQNLCNLHKKEIERMQSENYTSVAEPGTLGHLTLEKKYETIQVSNNDYIAAKTHEALCVFGFIGECDFENSNQ